MVGEWHGQGAVDPGRKRKQIRSASARYAAKREAEGLVRIAVWVPLVYADDLRDHAAMLVKRDREHAGESA